MNSIRIIPLYIGSGQSRVITKKKCCSGEQEARKESMVVLRLTSVTGPHDHSQEAKRLEIHDREREREREREFLNNIY